MEAATQLEGWREFKNTLSLSPICEKLKVFHRYGCF